MTDRTATVPHDAPAEDGSAWIDLLDVVALPRRLAVLSTLDRAGELALGELAARVAARVRGAPIGELPEAAYVETLATLHPSTCPRCNAAS